MDILAPLESDTYFPVLREHSVEIYITPSLSSGSMHLSIKI